jgi:hypothetical protein
VQKIVSGKSGGEIPLQRLFGGTKSGAVISAVWQVIHYTMTIGANVPTPTTSIDCIAVKKKCCLTITYVDPP